MTRYRNALPQLGGDLFLADGGIETTLIFHEGLELPYFAAFHLSGWTGADDRGRRPQICPGHLPPPIEPTIVWAKF